MAPDALLRILEILAVGVLGLLTKVVLGMVKDQADLVKTQYVINATLSNHFAEDLKIQREIAAHMGTQTELMRGFLSREGQDRRNVEF